MEIIRIPYWLGANRAIPATIVIILVLCWAATLKYRVRVRRPAPDQSDYTSYSPNRYR
jgi:hypothetical protein